MKITHEINSQELVANEIRLDQGASAFHWHEKYEICRLLDHDCDFLVDSEEIHGKKGDLITIREYDFHVFKPLRDDTHFHILQFLPKVILPSLQPQHQIKTHIPAEEIDRIPGLRQQLDTLYLWLEQELKQGKGAGGELSRLYARTLYLLLSRHFAAEKTKPGEERTEFYQIVEYVNAHFTEPINVSRLAKKLYLSRNRLSTVFLKFAGMPLTAYLDILRVEYANERLRAGADVLSAAYESGFSSIRTFHAVYKRVMKVTPTEYRKDGV